MASMLTENDDSSAVCWYRLLMTTFGSASRLSSMTTRVFSSDSSRTAVMSVMTFVFTNSAMRSTSTARLTLYGISVMTICSRPAFEFLAWPPGRAPGCCRAQSRRIA